MKPVASGLCLALLLALPGSPPAHALDELGTLATPETLRAEKRRLDETRASMQRARARLVVVSSQYDKLEEEREVNSRQQETLEKDLSEVTGKLRQVASDLAARSRELDEANSKFTRTFEDFTRRLGALYEMRSYPIAGLVFRSQGFGDFMRRWEYARILTSQDLRLMDELSAQRSRIEKQRATLAAEQKRMETLQQQKHNKNKALAQSIGRGREILDQLRAERVEAARRSESLERNSRALEDRLKGLQSQRFEEVAQRDPGPSEAARPRGVVMGRMGWPLDGDMEVLRPFGTGGRSGPPNPGIDIRVLAPHTVAVVDDGRVIHVGRLPSFGQVLMVDHGGQPDKIITVYGNLDAATVTVGQWVRRGDPVASIGRGPGETTLHFEVRKNAVPTDPLSWLER